MQTRSHFANSPPPGGSPEMDSSLRRWNTDAMSTSFSFSFTISEIRNDMGKASSLNTRADRKSQARQCLGFYTADFLSLLAYETQQLPNSRLPISSFITYQGSVPLLPVTFCLRRSFRSLSALMASLLTLGAAGKAMMMMLMLSRLPCNDNAW